MKRKVKIVNVTGRKDNPAVMAVVVDVENNDRISGGTLDRILQWLENDINYECVNVKRDRFGLLRLIDDKPAE